jgi:hypothetical protein
MVLLILISTLNYFWDTALVLYGRLSLETEDIIRMNNLAHLNLWLWRLDFIGIDNLPLLNL